MSVREPFEPESVKDWALIIHADSSGDRIDVYWVDIEAGRIGLRLADEVKQWRRRDDLLTIARRLRYVIPEVATGGPIAPIASSEPDPVETVLPLAPVASTEVDASIPTSVPVSPVEPSYAPERIEARHDYLAARVRALIEHSDTAKQALARSWPNGVSGLRNDGQSWEELDLIEQAVIVVETNHSVPFYPPFIDPAIEESKRAHPSSVWAKPREAKSTDEDKQTIQDGIATHPRSGLMRRWIGYAINGGIDHKIDTTALAHALFEFGSLDAGEWPDDDLTTMLDGSLRALGYVNGVNDLGRFNPDHAPLLMSAAFAIASGAAYLLFDDDEKPIVRTNVRTT